MTNDDFKKYFLNLLHICYTDLGDAGDPDDVLKRTRELYKNVEKTYASDPNAKGLNISVWLRDGAIPTKPPEKPDFDSIPGGTKPESPVVKEHSPTSFGGGGPGFQSRTETKKAPVPVTADTGDILKSLKKNSSASYTPTKLPERQKFALPAPTTGWGSGNTYKPKPGTGIADGLEALKKHKAAEKEKSANTAVSVPHVPTSWGSGGRGFVPQTSSTKSSAPITPTRMNLKSQGEIDKDFAKKLASSTSGTSNSSTAKPTPGLGVDTKKTLQALASSKNMQVRKQYFNTTAAKKETASQAANRAVWNPR